MARRDNAPAKRKTNRELTGNQQEWLHQVQNLKRRIKSLEGLGAVVEYPIPAKMPTTKSGKVRVEQRHIEELKSITRKELEKYAKQVGEFGELVPFVPPARGWTKQRREQVKRERESEEHFPEGEERVPIEYVELDGLLSEIRSLEDEDVIEMLVSIVGGAVADKGEAAINEIARRYRDDLKAYAVNAQKYKGQSKGGEAISKFTSIIKGSALSAEEMRVIERANDRFDDFSSPA